MRLGAILASLDTHRIAALARAVIPGADDQPASMWVPALENVLRGTGYVEHLIVTQRPPVLALLISLLETDGRALQRQEARGAVVALTRRWEGLVSDGEICGDVDRCQLYRRLLAAAWGNDLRIDASESHLLGLLRREVGMTQAEHYLISHHRDVSLAFAHGGDDYDVLVEALCEGGLLYEIGGWLHLPDELAPNVRRALGVKMGLSAMRRLLQHLGNDELRDALQRHHLRLMGTKPERIERLIDALAPIEVTLDVAHINDLKDLSRKLGLGVGGTKEQIIERLVDHFDRGQDLVPRDSGEPDIPVEPKALADAAFGRLFDAFTSYQLKDVLMALDLRHSGTKEKQIESLWTGPYAEATILRKFSSTDLQEALEKLGVDKRGTKEERAARLIGHFTAPAGASTTTPGPL